jgi:DNA-binding beta-propeller fold protein YncE
MIRVRKADMVKRNWWRPAAFLGTVSLVVFASTYPKHGTLSGSTAASLYAARIAPARGRLDAGTGLIATVHSARLGHPVFMAVDERTRHVFVVGLGPVKPPAQQTGYSTVSMLDATTGRLLRSVTIGAGAGGGCGLAIAPHIGRVFVTNPSGTSPVTYSAPTTGTVSILDTTSGALVHSVSLGLSPDAVAVDERTNRAFVLNANLANGYLPVGPASVSVLDATTGGVLRTVSLPARRGQPGAGPFAAVVDEQTGRVIVATADHFVDILDARSGALLKLVDGLHPFTLAVDAARGQVIVQGEGGISTARGPTGSTVYVVDDRTGRVVRSYTMNQERAISPCRTVVVDGRRGRAFIAAVTPS